MKHSNGERKEKKHYSIWENDLVMKNKITEMLQNVGFPLEMTTRKKLSDHGYNASNSYYTQFDYKSSQEIARELDIFAKKTVDKISYKGCDFSFELTLIGDCKSSSTNDFFGFASNNQSLDRSFPVIFEGAYFPEMSLSADFTFPSIIQNITEIDTNNFKAFPENKVIYEGCSQIFNAFIYFIDISGNEERTKEYLTIYDNTQSKFVKFTQEKRPTAILGDGGRYHYDKDVIKDFVNSAFESDKELFTMIGKFTIHIGIPVMIIGANNGLHSVDMKNGKVYDVTNIGYSAYLYTPKEINSASKMLVKDSNFDIIICNVDFLDDCLRRIEDGVRGSVHKILAQIQNNPYLLYYEIYNNSLNLRRHY